MIIERTIKGFKVTLEQISNIPSTVDEYIKDPLIDFFNYVVFTPEVVQFASHMLDHVLALCSILV